MRGGRAFYATFALFLAAVLALGTAWMVANPIGGAYDEMANHVKALASADGQWSGQPSHQAITVIGDWPTTSIEATALAPFDRVFSVSPKVAIPAQDACTDRGTGQSATCQAAPGDGMPAAPSGRVDPTSTYVGTYPPFLFTLVGLPGRLAGTLGLSVYLVRVAGSTLCALLWASAALLAVSSASPQSRRRRSRRRRFLGVAVAMSPMALFLPASESTNGIEIAAAACFWAGLICVTRPDSKIANWQIALTAVAGVVFALCRQFDPVFVVVAIATVCLYRGRIKSLASALLPLPAAAVVLACLAMLAWDLTTTSHTGSISGSWHRALTDLQSHWWIQTKDLVGIFGWGELTAPLWMYALWMGLIGWLLLTIRRPPVFQVLGIAACAVVTVAAAVFIDIAANAPMGFDGNGRYVLALAVGIPLLAAECDGDAGWSATWLTGLAGALQFGFLYVVLRRYSVGGQGPIWFVGHGWEPPAGQLLWLVVALAGAAAIAAAAVSVSRWRDLPAPESVPQPHPQPDFAIP